MKVYVTGIEIFIHKTFRLNPFKNVSLTRMENIKNLMI